MMSIWERSETFAHGYVVFPIFLYLLWREREALANIERKPYLPALLGVAGAGAVWFIGERVNAAVVSQLAMVAMVPFAVWAVLGTRVASALCIPLAFLFFAVPFGDFLVPHADGLDRRLHGGRDQGKRRARLSRRQQFCDSLRPVVRRRGVQRNPLSDRVVDGGMPVRLPVVPITGAPRAVHRCLDCRSDHRQLVARVHDRDARSSLRQPHRGGRGPSHLWLGVLRHRHGPAVLGRIALA